jgi:plastocyanin
MWSKLVGTSLFGVALLAGADIRGTITIDRKLTHRNVTASAGIYQRGVAVPLETDADDDPVAFERSHVAVYIESSPAGSAGASKPLIPPTPPAIEQRDRRFFPDLVVIPAGSTVSFPNFDPIFHNVFSLSKAKSFDLGNYPKGQTRTVSFTAPGIIAVYCHLHSNMSATIMVTPNRWATRADGTGAFTLKDVPAGTYTVVAWHKAAGTFRRTITIGESGEAPLNFTLPFLEASESKPIAHR